MLRWYTDVVKQGNLIEYGPVKGTMIFKPNSFGIWEQIQKALNGIFNSLKIQNVYLPLFIPDRLLAKEKEHIAGFNPELATITKVGWQRFRTKNLCKTNIWGFICWFI
nr:hypothetical protein [Mycoplasmopsis bovis]